MKINLVYLYSRATIPKRLRTPTITPLWTISINDDFPISSSLRHSMRLSVGSLIRRARRVGVACFFSSSQPKAHAKHVKIDDEEKQLDDDTLWLPRKRAWYLPRLMKMLLLTLLVLLVILLSMAYTIYKPPTLVIKFLQWKYPDVLFHVPLAPTQKVVALTLDDAPTGETAKLLDLLKFYGAKATFFIIGSQIASHSELLQRIHDEGHEVGNHAWKDEPSLQLPLSELEQQIKEVETLIPANSDGLKYFRPGSGFFSKQMVARVKTFGYRVVLGSIYPHDPQVHSPKRNAKHVLSMVKPGGIIIMHDRRSYSAEQLELVLKGLKGRDWKVESLGGLLRIAEESKEKTG